MDWVKNANKEKNNVEFIKKIDFQPLHVLVIHPSF